MITSWQDVFDLYSCYKTLREPEYLNYIRQQVKALLISTQELQQNDFYEDINIAYIPKKFALKRRLNYEYTFNSQTIAQTIFMAHQRDQSFQPITLRIQAILAEINQPFSSLIILASGSGYLAAYLASTFDEMTQAKINQKIYGVDISDTMCVQSHQNFLNHQANHSTGIEYHVVRADCVSWPSLASAIPEFMDNTPMLIISHGGARYFAQDREEEFINTVTAFPKGSRTIITEVGAELRQLMDRLAAQAEIQDPLTVQRYPVQQNTVNYVCWNLAYYYYLMQLYAHSATFRHFINSLTKPGCHSCTSFYNGNGIKADNNLTISEELSCLNLILLEIAGARKQPIYLLELDHNIIL